MNTGLLLIWLHVVANVLWIGSICGVAMVVTGEHGEPKTRGELGHRLYLRLAVPAFGASLLLGLGRLFLSSEDTALYMKQPWMHAKLTVAVLVIALHHVIGARAKKMARGEAEDAGKTGLLAVGIAVLAAAAAFFVQLQVPSGG